MTFAFPFVINDGDRLHKWDKFFHVNLFFALFVEQLVLFVKQMFICNAISWTWLHVSYLSKKNFCFFFSCFCFAVLFTFFPFFNYLPLCIGLCRSGALPSTRLQLAGELASALQPALTWRHLPIAQLFHHQQRRGESRRCNHLASFPLQH